MLFLHRKNMSESSFGNRTFPKSSFHDERLLVGSKLYGILDYRIFHHNAFRKIHKAEFQDQNL
jgi:hypothetical protein